MQREDIGALTSEDGWLKIYKTGETQAYHGIFGWKMDGN